MMQIQSPFLARWVAVSWSVARLVGMRGGEPKWHQTALSELKDGLLVWSSCYYGNSDCVFRLQAAFAGIRRGGLRGFRHTRIKWYGLVGARRFIGRFGWSPKVQFAEMSKPSFAAPVPQSALLSKLQAFLPQMEKQNEILAKDLATGQATKYNIEVAEEDPEKQVIEMNFALSILNEDSDSDDSSDDDEREIQLKPSAAAPRDIRITAPTSKPSPLIQELS
ncbi:hypothetical protein SDRG_14389 [Saprolegnia diclina VS20]|uniref:Uncharacterized protein n=1 Tax=Saprolegnia diclina (strain VS20) TaxID=1156394 RepID=T0Q322_SAPDV|nr:hypothetical protein SDRG_14389 [Saprolegnia diclina VS20]EQC27805.1 hypothetical protein SDRG_14389 [Saprolegnia diclina VS20]|eukprot:XP_008618735.1 hypothetical protein SDRG_14389 [Saprolegnia diclina VS20]